MDTLPTEVPYLSVPTEYRRKWQGQLGESKFLKVGLAWAGSNNDSRSLCLQVLEPLAGVSKAQFFCLQKGTAADQVSPPGLVLINLMDRILDFADTAAIIEQLDLIVSVDTSVAHLAGALGKAVWLMRSGEPDFRWLLGREDSPWYPTMRIFCQTAAGDWAGVVQRVAKALKERCQ